MKYSEDEQTHRAILRYSHLSAYAARNESEEIEAHVLHEMYGEVTGWTLHGMPASMPLAPNYEFSISRRSDGLDILLWDKNTKLEKRFFLAGIKKVDGIKQHMLSLTDTLCEQFVVVKVPKTKNKKVDAVEP